jgi:hypothetical protein
LKAGHEEKIAAPPMNLLGPELRRDLIALIRQSEADDTVQVIVFKSADRDHFVSHVDLTRIKEPREERYGWINRALPTGELGFPAPGHVAIKDRVNAIALAPAEDFGRDSEVFGTGLRNPETQKVIQSGMKRGLQTRDAEMDLARIPGGPAAGSLL